jgi:hypothetical protein
MSGVMTMIADEADEAKSRGRRLVAVSLTWSLYAQLRKEVQVLLVKTEPFAMGDYWDDLRLNVPGHGTVSVYRHDDLQPMRALTDRNY